MYSRELQKVLENKFFARARVCVCVCACARARACLRACCMTCVVRWDLKGEARLKLKIIMDKNWFSFELPVIIIFARNTEGSRKQFFRVRACVYVCVCLCVCVWGGGVCERAVQRVRAYLHDARHTCGSEGCSEVEVQDKDETHTHACKPLTYVSLHACHAHHAHMHACHVRYVMHAKLGLRVWCGQCCKSSLFNLINLNV